MKFETMTIIEELENQLAKGYKLPIFSGYVAINKRGFEHFIDRIYAALPEDVHKARNYLRQLDYNFDSMPQKTNSTIYDSLKNLETYMDESSNFMNFVGFIVLNIKELEKILKQIEDDIPQEIKKAQKIHH